MNCFEEDTAFHLVTNIFRMKYSDFFEAILKI